MVRFLFYTAPFSQQVGVVSYEKVLKINELPSSPVDIVFFMLSVISSHLL